MKLQTEINKVEIPDNYSELDLLQKLALFWGIISFLLRLVKVLTPKKTDDAIDKLIDLGKDVLPLKQ